MKWICPKCNTENGELLNICTNCMEDRPPETEVLSVPFSPPAEIKSPIPAGAGFWIRALARLADLLYSIVIGIVVGLFGIVAIAILARFGKVSPEWMQLVDQRSFGTYGLSILGAFLYHTAAEGIGGASLGKLIFGLRVVHVDGRPATLKSTFLRDLAYHFDALFFGFIGYLAMQESRLQQRYGDKWGGTVVVKTKVFQSTPPRGAGRITLGILFGSFLWGSMIFLGMLLKVL